MSLCKFCRERIPEDDPVIETDEGEDVCAACHDERLEAQEEEGCAR